MAAMIEMPRLLFSGGLEPGVYAPAPWVREAVNMDRAVRVVPMVRGVRETKDGRVVQEECVEVYFVDKTHALYRTSLADLARHGAWNGK